MIYATASAPNISIYSGLFKLCIVYDQDFHIFLLFIRT